MNSFFIHGFISSHLAQAICRTFLHSLWQGLLVAAISGLIIIGTRKTGAAIRYNLLSIVFTCFLIGSITTFLIQLEATTVSVKGKIVQLTPPSNEYIENAHKEHWLPAFQKDQLYRQVIMYSDKYAALVTGTWLIIFFLQLSRMSVGLYRTDRLRKRQLVAPAAKWQERVQLLKESLGIHAMVSLLESALVNMPVVIGVVKPVILVPLGMLSQLSPQQVETILLHELAHVRRRDFTMNLFQRVAECFFFFNPFIIWLSARIREEREACCDDIVMQHTCDKRSYLEALISFRQPERVSSLHALALGQKNNLLNRVKRMVTHENNKLNAMEKLTLIFVLMAVAAISFMPAQKQPVKQEKTAAGQQVAQQPLSNQAAEKSARRELNPGKYLDDTLPDKEHITFKIYNSRTNDDGTTKPSEATAKGRDGKDDSYRLKNHELRGLSIDGVKVPATDYGRYKGLIDDMESARQEMMNKSALKSSRDLAELLERKTLLNNKLSDLQSDGLLDLKMKQQLILDKQRLSESDNIKLKLLNDILLQEKRKYLDFSDEQSDLLKKTDLMNEKQKKLKEFEDADQIIRLKEMQESPELNFKKQLDGTGLALDQLKLKNQILSNQDVKFHDSNYQLAEITAILAQAGLIADMNNFSFTLNNEELIVDGKKQPGELYESLRQKFIRHKKDYFKYTAKPKKRSTEVYVE